MSARLDQGPNPVERCIHQNDTGEQGRANIPAQAVGDPSKFSFSGELPQNQSYDDGQRDKKNGEVHWLASIPIRWNRLAKSQRHFAEDAPFAKANSSKRRSLRNPVDEQTLARAKAPFRLDL